MSALPDKHFLSWGWGLPSSWLSPHSAFCTSHSGAWLEKAHEGQALFNWCYQWRTCWRLQTKNGYNSGVLSETGRVSSAAKPFLLWVVGGSPPLDCHFPSTGLLQTEGLLCLCPSQGENGPCLADPKGWTNTPLSILPPLSFQGCLDVAGFPDGTRYAGLDSCCWTEQMGRICIFPSLHTPSRALSRATQLVAVCSRVSVGAAFDKSGCCCLSHELCLPLLIPPTKCMDLLGSQCCQWNHHLALEHFGSLELDLSALFSINRALVASSGANVRALWICAKVVHAGGCLLRGGAAMR